MLGSSQHCLDPVAGLGGREGQRREMKEERDRRREKERRDRSGGDKEKAREENYGGNLLHYFSEDRRSCKLVSSIL